MKRIFFATVLGIGLLAATGVYAADAPAGATARLGFGTSKLASVRGTSLTKKIKRTGTYYVGLTLGKSPAAGITYTLTLKR